MADQGIAQADSASPVQNSLIDAAICASGVQSEVHHSYVL